MAEALGTVASILQLVDVAVKAGEYIRDFHHAPQEQKKLLSEMDELRPLLGELANRISANASSGVLQQMSSPLAAFKLTMEKFTDTLRPADKAASKISKRLKWMMWDKKEANEYLSKFEQFKSLLNSWLLLDIWDMGQQHRRDQIAALNSVDTVTNMVNSSVSHMSHAISEQEQRTQAEERSRIIEWLSPINFFLRHADVSQARQAETGKWLLMHPHFQEWESRSGGTLWCYGIPGAGKTVLASMVIEHLHVKPAAESIGVACIYLNHKEVEVQTPANLLAGIWRQLVLGKEIRSIGKQVYQRHSEKGTRASTDELHEVLRDAISQYSKVYIVVDAVDEYPEDARHILLQHLASAGPSINIMITSRPHILPDPSLPNLKTVEIRADEDDIRKYVDAHIAVSSRLSKHIRTRPELRDEIFVQIATAVDGMFLLAKLHIQSLSTKSTIKAVREALKSLPTDLNDTYEDAMKRIADQSEEDRKIAHSTLMWVANAKRLLRVSEIRVALAIEPGARQLDEDNILDIELILSVCAGLVIVDEQLSVVRLVHYTTQEYLDRIQAQRFPDAETEITRSLLTFLAFDDSPKSSWKGWTVLLPPLVDYAQHWPRHAAGRPEKELRDMILDFLVSRAVQWNECLDQNWNSPPWNFLRWPKQFSPFWFAAAANLLDIANYLLLKGMSPPDFDLDSTREYDANTDHTALQAASYYGHLEMAQLLIAQGANVNARRGLHRSALSAAASADQPRVAELLIENGADIDAQESGSASALEVAVSVGHKTFVQVLLRSGADVNLDDGAALYSAVSADHHELIPLLIENGADPNANVDTFHMACAECDIQHVRLFIENGVNIDTRAEYLGSPLHAACFRGSVEIVQLLLENGADANTWSDEYGSPLAAASFGGHEPVAQLLIANGGDVNAPGVEFEGNALEAASEGGHEGIVLLLIKNGAEVNGRSEWYGGALQSACTQGRTEIVRLLIASGADVEAPGGFYGSPMRAAISCGHEDVVMILLENGAVDYRNVD